MSCMHAKISCCAIAGRHAVLLKGAFSERFVAETENSGVQLGEEVKGANINSCCTNDMVHVAVATTT